jgi:hypothetical protein
VNIEGVGKFLVKVDDPREGEKASGATAIATRLYHAAGWWSACDTVIYIDRSWLKLKPGLTYADNGHVKRPFDEPKLDQLLENAQRRGSQIRVLASRWLPGRTIGPFTYQGTRDDDPNDVVPHEDRRDLRGARLIAAWLGHFDSREQNTMTTWAAVDRENKESSPGHTIHWYLDLGDCFGSHWEIEAMNRRIGHSYYFDAGDIAVDFLTFGMVTRPWDDPVPNRELPMFDYFRPDFDPDAWKGGYPNPAFARMTEHDAAWAARIISRFDDDLLAVAVAQGDYSDPKASAFLTQTLAARRDRIQKRYFAKLSPLGDVREVDGSVCATDHARRTLTWLPASFHYGAKIWTGASLRDETSVPVQVGDDGEVCVKLPRVATEPSLPSDDALRYGVVDITNGIASGPLRVHFYDLGPDKGFALVAVQRPDDGARDF